MGTPADKEPIGRGIAAEAVLGWYNTMKAEMLARGPDKKGEFLNRIFECGRGVGHIQASEIIKDSASRRDAIKTCERAALDMLVGTDEPQK